MELASVRLTTGFPALEGRGSGAGGEKQSPPLKKSLLRLLSAAGFSIAVVVPALAHAAGEDTPVPIEKQINTAKDLMLILGGGLVVLILVAIAVMVFRKAFGSSHAEAAPSGGDAGPDPLAQAAGEEQRGNFSSAAAYYEAGGKQLKAAECWEKIKDLSRAAACWEAGGDLNRAAQLHARSGSALRAAGIYMRTNNYIEAAKIFRNKGDHLRAAQALELYGNKVAAAREYAAAGNHEQAARLLEQERLLTEAAGAARAAPAPLPSLEDPAGEIELDADVDPGDRLHRVFTLRSMIHAGRMEPRYSMRLWVQMMRALSGRHGAGGVVGSLTPDSIVIDMENNVRIDTPANPPSEYLSPEVRAGLPPDRQADIYSMGVILYELVSGSLEQFGRKRAGELFPEVPSWLDELIERCTEKDLAKRFRTTEEVSAALLKLKNAV